MKSKVYFYNLRANKASSSLSSKVARIFDVAGFKNIIDKNDLVAIKIHFGEKGNNAYINP
ncbi:4Fe-4S ferredoxin, partial [Weissella cibaria]|nr:4Fe-4S ferredoxin [Weissella cibaria]